MKRSILTATIMQTVAMTGMAWAADKGALSSTAGLSASILSLIVFGVGFYFLPTIIGFARKKDNKISILLLNFFLGWSLIGWVAALVWATSKDKVAVQHIYVQQAPPAP